MDDMFQLIKLYANINISINCLLVGGVLQQTVSICIRWITVMIFLD